MSTRTLIMKLNDFLVNFRVWQNSFFRAALIGNLKVIVAHLDDFLDQILIALSQIENIVVAGLDSRVVIFIDFQLKLQEMGRREGRKSLL